MTAYRYWDRVWQTNEGRAEWATPDPWVVANVAVLRHLQVRQVLDLGCGVGRHSLLLASKNFVVQATDMSWSAVRAAADSARAARLPIGFAMGDSLGLPFPTGTFDAVLAFNVVYHNDEAGFAATLGEIRRVLRAEGIYLSTMLSKRHRDYGRGTEVSSNTFCQADARDDKVHPHLYADLDDLRRLHSGFDLKSAVDRDQTDDGSFHWRCDFRRSGR